jgi:hypothetical protein
VGWEFKLEVPKEGSNGREAQIAAPNADSTLLLNMIEKRPDERRIDFFQYQCGRGFVQTLVDKLEE